MARYTITIDTIDEGTESIVVTNKNMVIEELLDLATRTDIEGVSIK